MSSSSNRIYMTKKAGVSDSIKALPQNMFSGFVVSLIALPLGLGLAIASEAPPLAGIIAAVVGGIVVSLFGGSHVTIAGPGNGLVIVLLASITTLGEGNLFEVCGNSQLQCYRLGIRAGSLADIACRARIVDQHRLRHSQNARLGG